MLRKTLLSLGCVMRGLGSNAGGIWVMPFQVTRKQEQGMSWGQDVHMDGPHSSPCWPSATCSRFIYHGTCYCTASCAHEMVPLQPLVLALFQPVCYSWQPRGSEQKNRVGVSGQKLHRCLCLVSCWEGSLYPVSNKCKQGRDAY